MKAHSTRLEKVLEAAALANECEISRRVGNLTWHLSKVLSGDDLKVVWWAVTDEAREAKTYFDIPVDKTWLDFLACFRRGIESAAISETARKAALAALDSFEPKAPTEHDKRLREIFYQSKRGKPRP
jgi:hypothetical protein